MSDKHKEAASTESIKKDIAVSNPTDRTKIFWIVCGFIGIILSLIIFSGGHAKKEPTAIGVRPMVANDSNSELQRNLAKLRSQQKKEHQTQVTQPKTKSVGTSFFKSRPSQTKYSKEYLMELSAPSNVYEAAPPQGQTGQNAKAEVVIAGQGSQSQFLNQQTQTTTLFATRISHPRYTIASGEFLHATLETAIQSNLPGMVRAVVTRPVYAYVGKRPLIPAGARLIGQYASNIAQGHRRVMVVWNRVILPNGIAIQINSPGTNAIGIAGQGADSINHHFFARFGQATLLSLIGASAANLGVGAHDQFNSADAYRSAIAQSFQQSAKDALKGSASIGPTLHIYQGASINVFVAHDLNFYNVLKDQR